MESNATIVHQLTLPIRKRIAEMKILAGYKVCDKVLYEGEMVEIISIYSEASPLCGYVLVSGKGIPVLGSKIKRFNNKTT